jgi:hypothetical protein
MPTCQIARRRIRQLAPTGLLAGLVALASACTPNAFCSTINPDPDCEEGRPPPVYSFTLYWSVEGSQARTTCADYGIAYWIIDLDGNGRQQQRLSCAEAAGRWSWRFWIGRTPLFPGRYTATVAAFDALDRELARRSEAINLSEARNRSLDLELSDGDFGRGGCRLAGGSGAWGVLPALLLALVLALARVRVRRSSRPAAGLTA